MEITGISNPDYITKLAKGNVQTEQEKKDIKNIVSWTVKKYIEKISPKIYQYPILIEEIIKIQMNRFFGL